MKTKFFMVYFVLAASLLHAQNFTKITTGPVVTDARLSSGSNWIDYDNDGYLDLFRASSLAFLSDHPHVLYKNNGDGSFDKPVLFSQSGSANNASSSWGDYDNDGYPDLYVVTTGNVRGNEKNKLWTNNGDGTFTPVPANANVNDEHWSNACSWGDYNNDGDLDIFVTNAQNDPFDNSLYENNGDGTFNDISGAAIVRDGASSWGCSWADFDNDGDLDLFVANNARLPGRENNLLYRNVGNGIFSLETSGAIVTDGGDSYGSSWGDYDNDGDLDLFVNNHGGEGTRETNFLYQNNGDGSFKRITSGAIVNEPIGGLTSLWASGSGWGDYDNDGDLDLVVTADNNVLYQNDGAGTFTRLTSGELVEDNGGASTIWGDYDNDGDLDLFVSRNGTSSLYRNEATANNDNNWINFTCVGTLSNRSAIGAKVRIKAVISGEQVQQLREISGQTGLYSQNSLRVHFGLGDATVIDTVRIEWPSHQVQLLTNVAVNQFLRISEILPPAVEHTPISVTEAGNQITLEATGGADITAVDLLYRQGGDSTFTTVPITDQGNGSFQGIIPASAVTSKGVDYRCVARDIAGNTGREPADGHFSVQVHVSNGISREKEEPFGSGQTAYHLFSVPLDLDDKTPAAIFEDDMGEYDDSRWRLLEYLPEDGSYLEYPEISAIEPSKGYWFLVTEPARIIDTGAGTSFTTAEPYSSFVRPGWNLIGNPFNFSIPGANFSVKNITEELRSYNGSWNNPISDPITHILPFEGYAVFSESMVNEFAFIDGNVPEVGSPLAKTSASEKGILWFIEIHAQSQQARDVDNVAGVSIESSRQWDTLDYPEPPAIGEYVSVYFPHPEWDTRSTRYSTDFRPEFAHGSSWEFEVKSNIRDRVQLSFAGLEAVPPEFEVWLVDELNLTHNLRDDPQFFVAGSEEHPKRLELLIGKSEFIGESLANVQSIPSDFELSQNFPNPFNPATTIRYGLPRDESVTLKIYNILGKEVVTLLNNERKAAGNHLAIWDGRNSQGQVVASGIYVYQLRAGEFSKIRKMAFLR